MSKRDKILIALALFGILCLALITYFVSDKIATLQTTITNIAQIQKLKPNVYNGTDGKDGESIKGADGLNGVDGKNGQDSQSTYIERNTIEQVPLAGTEGQPGKDAPMQETRINPETGDLETRMENDAFWNVLIPCDQLMKSCPTPAVTEPEEAL